MISASTFFVFHMHVLTVKSPSPCFHLSFPVQQIQLIGLFYFALCYMTLALEHPSKLQIINTLILDEFFEFVSIELQTEISLHSLKLCFSFFSSWCSCDMRHYQGRLFLYACNAWYVMQFKEKRCRCGSFLSTVCYSLMPGRGEYEQPGDGGAGEKPCLLDAGNGWNWRAAGRSRDGPTWYNTICLLSLLSFCINFAFSWYTHTDMCIGTHACINLKVSIKCSCTVGPQ